ncbi:HNH endonuclease [bacterium]|nr:HNH endonuclease [bacterium]
MHQRSTSNGTSVLHERTLVLNKHWTAVATTTVRTALVLLYRETARVICPDTYEVYDLGGWIGRSQTRNGAARAILTPRYRIEKPEVILLREYGGRPRREVTFSRKNLYRRDNYTCQYCGQRRPSEELSIDHVTPKSQGGRTAWDNCVLACIRCNTRKANKTLRDVGFQLIAKPEKPRWSPFEEVSKRERPVSWEKFLSDEYWNSELRD